MGAICSADARVVTCGGAEVVVARTGYRGRAGEKGEVRTGDDGDDCAHPPGFTVVDDGDIVHVGFLVLRLADRAAGRDGARVGSTRAQR